MHWLEWLPDGKVCLLRPTPDQETIPWPEATAAVSPLRRRMIDDMSLRNLSPATQRSYLHAVAKFSRYFGRSPDRMGLEDVRAFQVYLVSQGISWPTLSQTVCALRFFYGVTLDRAEIPDVDIAIYKHPPPVRHHDLDPAAAVRHQRAGRRRDLRHDHSRNKSCARSPTKPPGPLRNLGSPTSASRS